jgi:hypothetical protein
VAQRNASTTLGNSIKIPSPVVFDDPAFMLNNFWIDQFTPMRLEAFKGALFVFAHYARVGDYVGG